ncbi:hypothetical protein HYR99_31835 [Candidatus Poribacteria bacterium]|nr:hypothetical protein [Candidatus Poribacteria bacterium]
MCLTPTVNSYFRRNLCYPLCLIYRFVFSIMPQQRSVTLRAVLIALILTIPNSYWLMINWGPSGYGSGQSFPTVATLYFNVIFFILLLIALNYLLRIVSPFAVSRVASTSYLNDGELLVIYLLLSIASSIAGHDTLQILWPLLSYSIWFAQPENEWAELFHRFIPDWLTAKDRSAIATFYQGESTFYTWKHLQLWLTPVLWWSALIIVLTGMMLCLTILVRRQWVTHEKLSYPVIQIPLQLTEQSGRTLFRNGLMWVGFLLAGGMNLLNGLHFLFPIIPGIGGSLYNLGRHFQTKPLDAIGYLPVAVYPFAIGLSFFIPLDLSFSIWFFFLFHKMTRIWGTMLGIGHLPGFPYLEPQSFGAWFCIGMAALWTTRKFLTQQIHLAFQGRMRPGLKAYQDRTDSTTQSTSEVRLVRGALVGLFVGWIFVLFFFMSTGISAINIFAYFALFFALAIAITRVRAEVGPPSHDVPWRPDKTLVSFLGTRQLGPEGLTVFSMFYGFNRSYRCHPMPIMLEGFKAAELQGMSPSRLIISMMLVTVVSTISSAWAFYAQGYHYGGEVYGEQAQCRWTYEQLRLWLITPQSPDGAAITVSIGAMVFTGLLMAARRWFIWWPFHPAGYALSLSYWNTSWYWFSIFLSWLFKFILFRVGGIRVYRKGMPFFIGLVLGEFTVGAIWTLIGISLERPMYRFMF